MNTEINKVVLHLSLIPGVGPGCVEKIVTGIKPSELCCLYDWESVDFCERGVSKELAKILVEGLSHTLFLDEELTLLEKKNIFFVTLFDDAYPELLRTIHLPPLVLYYQGLPVWQRRDTIAFVGSRKANVYGKQAVDLLVPDIVQAGWVTVSGGAYGIDAAVHQATVESGGATVAVLGSGLLKPYPVDHKKLFAKIIDTGGAVVSSFPLETAPFPGNFPARNRIISGMSKGTVVVQAAQKSGALITARYALEQGRSVFAVPGPIGDPLSKGCHDLLHHGARIVTDASDILDEYGISINRQTTLLPLDEVGMLILTHVNEPKTVDELIEMTSLSENALTHYLFELQLNGYIEQNFAGLWQRA